MPRPVPLLLVCLFFLASSVAQSPPGGYYGQQPQKSLSELDEMVASCFLTTCKEWMLECHWYCDSLKERTRRNSNCHKCLSFRGDHCLKCFEL